MKTPFQGELMTCVMCGKQHKSDPHVESNWTTIDMGGQRWYICPDELPLNKTATRWDFKRAYERIFHRIGQLISEEKP